MEIHRKGSELTECPFWGKHWLCSGVKVDAIFFPRVLKIIFDKEHIFMYYSCILKGGNSNIEGEEKITLAAALEESDVEVRQMENDLGFPPPLNIANTLS